MKHLLQLFFFLLLTGWLSACTDLDTVNQRLDALEQRVSSLETATEQLQQAYAEGKIITDVTPFYNEERGWIITFSDGSKILITDGKDGQDGKDGVDGKDGQDGKDGLNGTDGKDGANGQDGKDGEDGEDGEDGKDGQDGEDGKDGKDGITPVMKVSQDGYWMVSYDNGQNFILLLDKDENRIPAVGTTGLSVRVTVNSEGYYVIQTYSTDNPDVVISEMPTPYPANPSQIIQSIEQDDVRHTVTITLADGSQYEFAQAYTTPTGIALLTGNVLQLSYGAQVAVEFRVNPSNALFDLNVNSPDCAIQLDCVGSVSRASSYVTPPTHFRLARVEQTYTDDGQPKQGQYRAIIEDSHTSEPYDDWVALVLTVPDARGELVQISSSAVEIKSFNTADIQSGQPIAFINTPGANPITSKTEWTTGVQLSLLTAEGSENYQGSLSMRGRGNSTWGQPKKPYALKLDARHELLGMKSHKRWILLANYLDDTLLRNKLSFQMAQELSLIDYTPHATTCEVVLNGKHIGSYDLCEKITVDPNRLDLGEGEGGFLLEIDPDTRLEDDDVWFKTNLNTGVTHYTIKDPDVETGSEEYNQIRDFMNQAEQALFSARYKDPEEGWRKYLDTDSFVECYLINEITKTPDCNFWTSCYMHRAPEGKLKMGPLWDFDLSYGNYKLPNGPEGINLTTGLWARKNSWYIRLFSDADFLSRVKERFAHYYTHRQQFFDYIDSTAQQLLPSALLNNRVWGTLGSTELNEAEATAAYMAHVDALKEWLNARFEWLNIYYGS